MKPLLALLLSFSPALAQAPGPGIDPTPISSLPFVIDQPGAYYVTKDLTCPSGGSGILIQANEVDLNLNGRTVRGESGSQTGILVTKVVEGLVIQNGFLVGLGGFAVDAHLAQRGHFEGLTIRQCVDGGLLSGPESTIVGCKATGNGGDGISGGIHGFVRDCMVSKNKGAGIRVALGSRVESCMAMKGFSSGIVASSKCVVSGCSSLLNSEVGIQVEGATLVENCMVHKNLGTGIEVTSTCTVRSCKVDFPGGGQGILRAGIVALENENVIEGNTVSFGARAVQVLGLRNYVAGNLSRSNIVAYEFPGGNFVATVVTDPSDPNPRANLDL